MRETNSCYVKIVACTKLACCTRIVYMLYNRLHKLSYSLLSQCGILLIIYPIHTQDLHDVYM